MEFKKITPPGDTSISQDFDNKFTGFGSNKGYIAERHGEALASYKPMRDYEEKYDNVLREGEYYTEAEQHAIKDLAEKLMPGSPLKALRAYPYAQNLLGIPVRHDNSPRFGGRIRTEIKPPAGTKESKEVRPPSNSTAARG